MNSVNFKTVKNFTRGFLFAFFYFIQVKVHASEAVVAPKMLTKKPVSHSALSDPKNDEELLMAIKKSVQPIEPSKEIVILNTESGFIPDKISVKKGEAYKIHVVNVNMKEKNVSFLMDSFTQSHNTIFGLRKSFNIEPHVEGVFSYQCPETGIQGQIIVIPNKETRKVTNQEEEKE